MPTKKTDNKDDRILSTPSVTGSHATSESSNLTIGSGHVEADNKSFFLNFDNVKNPIPTDTTMNLKPDDDSK